MNTTQQTEPLTTFAGQAAGFTTHKITTRDYLRWIRSWYSDAVACPAGLPVVQPIGQHGADEVVARGSGSPYRFATYLRELVGDPDREVLKVPMNLVDGGYRGSLYFCWKPNGPDTGYPSRDQQRDMDLPGTLAIYHVG